MKLYWLFVTSCALFLLAFTLALVLSDYSSTLFKPAELKNTFNVIISILILLAIFFLYLYVILKFEEDSNLRRFQNQARLMSIQTIEESVSPPRYSLEVQDESSPPRYSFLYKEKVHTKSKPSINIA